jgi:hypothetical protein
MFAEDLKLTKSATVSTRTQRFNRSSFGVMPRRSPGGSATLSAIRVCAFLPMWRYCSGRPDTHPSYKGVVIRVSLQVSWPSFRAIRVRLPLAVRGRYSVGGLYHLASHSHEFFQASTWNDDRIPTPMRFLGDAHKAPSLIFAKFNVEMLTFDLEFFRDNYVIHDAWRGYHLAILHLTTHRQRRNPAK